MLNLTAFVVVVSAMFVLELISYLMYLFVTIEIVSSNRDIYLNIAQFLGKQRQNNKLLANDRRKYVWYRAPGPDYDKTPGIMA
jgi:hypothetical protein